MHHAYERSRWAFRGAGIHNLYIFECKFNKTLLFVFFILPIAHNINIHIFCLVIYEYAQAFAKIHPRFGFVSGSLGADTLLPFALQLPLMASTMVTTSNERNTAHKTYDVSVEWAGCTEFDLYFALCMKQGIDERRASSNHKLSSSWLFVNDECCDIHEKKNSWEEREKRGKDPDEKGAGLSCVFSIHYTRSDEHECDCKHVLHPFNAHFYGPAAHDAKIR